MKKMMNNAIFYGILKCIKILNCTNIIEEADTMLDLKFVRENLELVKQNLDNRHTKGDLDTFVAAYDERKQLIQKG